MSDFFRGALGKLGWPLGIDIGEGVTANPSDQPQPGRKRKARDAPSTSQKGKARRLSQGRAQPQYRAPDYQAEAFYDDYARRAFHRGSETGSFELGDGAFQRFLDTGTGTYIEQPGTHKGRGGRLSLPLTGVRAEQIEDETEDIKEKIDDLAVPEDKKEEVRQQVAGNILDGPERPRRTTRGLHTPPSTKPERPRTTTPPRSKAMAGTRPRRTSSVEPDWTSAPNRTARKILDGYDNNKAQAATAIRDSLRQSDSAGKTEPLYSLRDIEIRDGMWQLNDKLERFAVEHYDFDFGSKGPGNKEVLDAQLASMPDATVQLIGCVASGGPAGATGWRNLFHSKPKRRALVCAIIGDLLEEQVFEHLFFGGSKEDEERVERLQQTHADHDGFDRKGILADYVAESLRAPRSSYSDGDYILPEGFDGHVQAVVEGLIGYLTQIDQLRPRNKMTLNDERKRITDLYKIVAHAGILSLIMRADPHTVYYFAPVFKEDDFVRKYMECFNEKEMKDTNPQERETYPSTWSVTEQRRSQGDRALNQITIMKGITTYRRGGWETGRSTPQEPEYVPGMEAKGVRTKILTHGWVYCRWGRPQKFVRGEPADRKEVHGIQWEDPGFMRFQEVVDAAKRKGKGKGRAV